ncbi:MAG TPA: F0F1 ATP synthase subunit delta [Candidatus Pristimantibacillus sp.]|jgi:F0F1-type ATP synthase delta subunit|nr:F0F1 ATP synthase subunit delta [Candidatus Pristimantibacillus sp.]
MKTPRTRIAGTIADNLLANGVSKEYAKEVAAYLLAEGRVGELDSLLRDIQAQWAAKGYIEVLARSAHPLDDEVRKNITDRIRALYPEAKKIVVTEVLDPSVLGGVRIDLANRQLDLSVEAKLNKFKQLTGAGKE